METSKINIKNKFNKAPTTENMACRLLSEDGKIEMGVTPMIFGNRIRAGYVGEPCCWVDWCCGANQFALEVAYNVCKAMLEHGIEFKKMRTVSEIKPYYNDHEFNFWLINQCNAYVVEPEKLPPISDIREEYFKIWREFIDRQKS